MGVGVEVMVDVGRGVFVGGTWVDVEVGLGSSVGVSVGNGLAVGMGAGDDDDARELQPTSARVIRVRTSMLR